MLAGHPSPPAPGFQLRGVIPCRQGRGRVEFRIPQSRDLILNFSHASTAVVAPGLLDERGREFERTDSLWGFCKDLTVSMQRGVLYLPV